MLVNLVDSEEKLRRTIGVLIVSLALVTFFSFIELLFPGKVILPNLIYSIHKVSLVMKNVRVMGPFRDYELLAQFFAVNVPILILMIVRSRRLLVRIMYVLLLVSVLFMQFATITRGAFISLMIGIVYMAWICRNDLNIVKLTGLVAAFVGMLVLINMIMSRYTVSGSLFARLIGTTIKSGFIPDTRVISWTGAVNRWLLHPFIGNGPGWDFTYNIEGRLWPHNSYLYYLNIIGIFGTAAFMFLLYRLVRASMKEVRRPLVASPFPRALMKVLHVSLVIFIIDMIKVDYQRNEMYMCFVWIFFALISASRAVIDGSAAPSRPDAGGPGVPG
jgi:O-antigen ligase